MALTLNAEQKSIYDIFSGENQYIIPPYQRAYSWTNVQCKALFEDIKKAFYDSEQEGYFLGNIVLAKSREERNKLEVIDGQQRLTTLILLIKVLLSFDKENKALYNAIWIKDRRSDKEIQRLQTDVFMEKDFNYFKEVLSFDFSKESNHIIKEENNLFKKNIYYLYNKIFYFSEHNDISKFSDFLLDRIYLLPIETEDISLEKARKNALQIFETINNRGINLSTSDIFKARLYSMALNELEHEKFIENWKKLQNKCDKLNCEIDDVFKIYSHILLKEQGDTFYRKIELKEFFLDNIFSPFLRKKQNEMMKDLLKICDFSIFVVRVIESSIQNQELVKWFQLVHQGIIDNYLHEYSFFDIFPYHSSYEEYDSLIISSKKIICNIHIEGMQMRDIMEYKEYYNFLLLLGLFLNKKQKAIYPYYIDENINIFDGNYSTSKKYKLFKKDFIELNSALKDSEKCKLLVIKAYDFIRDCNEN